MDSRVWWNLVVKNVFIEDMASKNEKNLNLHNEKLTMIANEIFNEFCSEKYWKKFENCDNLLNNLKSKGYIIGAISNFDERLFVIVKNLNIENYFDFILIPHNSNGNYKPQKEIFLQALTKSKIDNPKHSMVHIGDSLELDYIASKKCEYNSILMIHDKELKKPELVKDEYATSLKDLEKKIYNIF